jgi:hypothetical protein
MRRALRLTASAGSVFVVLEWLNTICDECLEAIDLATSGPVAPNLEAHAERAPGFRSEDESGSRPQRVRAPIHTLIA